MPFALSARRGPLKFASTTSTPLMAFRYMPSTVRTKPPGSSRSNPAESPRYWGYLKFGSVILTPTVPAAPAPGAACPAQAVGRALTSTVSGGACVVAEELLQFKRTRPRPVLAYALPRRMYGGGPVNTPIPPRI